MPFILEFHIVILAVPGGNSDIFTLLPAIVTLKVIHLDAIWQNLIKKIRKFKNYIKKKKGTSNWKGKHVEIPVCIPTSRERI